MLGGDKRDPRADSKRTLPACGDQPGVLLGGRGGAGGGKSFRCARALAEPGGLARS